MPADASGYELPEIEGFDREAAAASPLMQTVREAALEAGLDQAGFNKFVKKWVAGEAAKAENEFNAEMAKLGPDEAAITRRVNTLSGGLQRTLPADIAAALIGAATSAEVVKGLEALLSKSPNAGGGDPVPAKDDWATIEGLMNSDAYMGREDQRDPKVIARVDAYFAGGGRKGG